MRTVRWLHISDLHLNTPGYESSFLRDELPKFLKRSNIACDYVFCTGDLRDAQQGAFPDDQGQFLKDICKAVGSPELFVVPGNHDVDRGEKDPSKGDASRHEAIGRILSYYKSGAGIFHAEDLKILHDKQADFRSYISTVLPSDRMAFYSDSQKPHFNIETEFFNILHVDSTLSYTHDHESGLILGMSHLYEALKTVNKAKPTILLTHYAFTMLSQEERKRVRELLYRSGIQLWLAGHEHEHNLQPVNYLHSLQSGELRLDEECNTSVLVGEFDTESCAGMVKAYAWFPEGWYPYPAVWHGAGRDDVYPFALRLLQSGELRSPEAIRSYQHNQKYKQSHALVDSLFADIACGGTVYQGNTGLVGCLRDAWQKSENLVLIADGGMGKTTRLLAACDALDDKAAVYIPLERTEPKNLIRDVCRALFADSSEEQLYRLAKDRHSCPDLYLFLDGMNEVDGTREKEFVAIIRHIISNYPGIQFVIASRSNFTERYRVEGICVGRIEPLRQEQIQTLFSEDEWESIQTNPPLQKLIQNPLMATLYKHISPELGIQKEYIDWIENISNETELIFDYYLSQIALCLSKQEDQLINVTQYIRRCLPYIAFCFERESKHTMPLHTFRRILDAAVRLDWDDSIDAIRREMRIREPSELTSFDLEDYLFHVSHLMYQAEGVVSFPHQIHRDYLSAVWLTKTQDLLDCWNERIITTTVSNHVRMLSGKDYWNNLANAITDCARDRDDCLNLLTNVINTFPYTADSGLPDFSRLDFRGIRIPDYAYIGEKIRLNRTKIDEYSIGGEAGDITLLRGLSFSPDMEYLAGIAGHEVILYSMDTGLKVLKAAVYPDLRQVGRASTRFSLDSRFLFIKKRQDMIIFRKTEDGWRRVGEISRVFERKPRHAIIHDGVLSFYYTNRIRSYSLENAMLVENLEARHPYENTAEGEDIMKTASASVQVGAEEYSAAVSADGQYKAICYQDGKTVVQYQGGKILHNLDYGKGVLKTAAISKDGNRAVTLSANIYGGKRRIQLWDLDNRKKDSERFCTSDTESVYLTDHGDWIIGFEGGRTWVWNWEKPDRKFYRSERFISETERGLTTYGNCLLTQSEDGTLQEFNLDDQSLRSLGKYGSIQYATVLPGEAVATVDYQGRYVQFKSITSNQMLKINREQSKIKNVHAFKTQPFISVVTANGLISIYHIGTGQRTRKLTPSTGYRLVAFHPTQNVFSFSDGNKRLETFRYFEWMAGQRPRGKWCGPERPDFEIDGRVIAIGFNTVQQEQIVIETNGKITYMRDKFCDYRSQTRVITNFSVDGYDFHGVLCDQRIKNQLERNGAVVE